MQNDELRKAQTEVEESRHRYSDLYDFAPVGYVTLDEKGVIEEINITGSQMLGTDRSFLIGKPFFTFLMLPDLKAFMDHLDQSFKTEEMTRVELSLAPRGGILPVQMTSVSVRVEGEKALMRTVISDISGRKKVEEELDQYRRKLEDRVEERTSELKKEIEEHRETEGKLREREENFKRIMENATDGILVIRERGQFTANIHLAKMLGYKPDELDNLAFRDFVHPDQREKTEACVINLLEGKEVSHRCETRFVSKGGEIIPVELTSSSSTWHGKPAGLMVVRDIALTKKMEEEHLRTEKLESLGVLAGGIAHDFNNILTGILGSISLAENDPSSGDKSQVWLKHAENAVLRARDLTQQLLTFSKGGAPVKAALSMPELLKESVSFALSGSNIRCKFLISDDLLNVEADKGQINQVLHNIVINAVQAMPQGGVIRVGAENVTITPNDGLPVQEGKFVKIFIEDHGHRIPENYLQRIFDPYFTTKTKGSGLGLASAQSIVKKHGGHISVTSTVGTGTTFEIYLPASDKDIAERVEASEGLVTGSGKILVIDDEEMVRSITGSILREAGYEVEYARNGNEAIELYTQARASGCSFDLVIMDLTIPGGMGGQETIKELRALYPDVKAIVSSGYSNDPVMAEWEKYGFKGVVTKPYTMQDLTKIVKSVLKK